MGSGDDARGARQPGREAAGEFLQHVVGGAVANLSETEPVGRIRQCENQFTPHQAGLLTASLRYAATGLAGDVIIPRPWRH
jgi:hypothetical protein